MFSSYSLFSAQCWLSKHKFAKKKFTFFSILYIANEKRIGLYLGLVKKNENIFKFHFVDISLSKENYPSKMYINRKDK